MMRPTDIQSHSTPRIRRLQVPARAAPTPDSPASAHVPASESLRRIRQRRGQVADANGHAGERAAAELLAGSGWRVLSSRARTAHGEIDLVVRRGDTLAFVEVKAGRGQLAERAMRSIAASPWRRRRAAVAWLAANRPLHRGVFRYRFDVALVFLDQNGRVDRFEHVANAF